MAQRKQDTTAPLTSFDWSDPEPNLIITSSIDMSCMLWDLNVRGHFWPLREVVGAALTVHFLRCPAPQ